MKKFFLVLSLIGTIGMTSAFASEDPTIDPQVKESFKKEFPDAQHVQWNKDQEYLKATFTLADYRAEAWFDEDGELLGTVRDLLYYQLPLAVMKAVENRFPAGNTSEIREINNVNGTEYRMTIIAKKGKYNVSVTPDGFVSILKKARG